MIRRARSQEYHSQILLKGDSPQTITKMNYQIAQQLLLSWWIASYMKGKIFLWLKNLTLLIMEITLMFLKFLKITNKNYSWYRILCLKRRVNPKLLTFQSSPLFQRFLLSTNVMRAQKTWKAVIWKIYTWKSRKNPPVEIASKIILGRQ